jgi:hypothetical protein
MFLNIFWENEVLTAFSNGLEAKKKNFNYLNLNNHGLKYCKLDPFMQNIK